MQDGEGRWNVFTGRYNWDASCVCSNNPQYGGTGAAKTTAAFDCAPNIDHSNPRVRQVKQPHAWIELYQHDLQPVHQAGMHPALERLGIRLS